jgi:hypothetical protein
MSCFLFQEVRRYLTNDNSTAPYEVYAFSTATLNDILSQFSELNIVKVVVGYLSMVSKMLTDSYVCNKQFLHRLQ